MLHPAANRHPKATHQWLLMGVQACRLPALKRLKPLKRLKTFKILKTLKTIKTLQTVQKLLGTPNRAGNSAARGPHRLNILLACKTFKTLQTLQTVQNLLGTPNRAGNSAAPRPHRLNILLACFILQPTGTPRLTSMGSYGRPSLPFASPETLKTFKTLENPQNP